MIILTLIYAIYLYFVNSNLTFNNNLINNHYISYFIGLICFFILGLLSVLKTDKNFLLNSLINFIIIYFIIISIKVIGDNFDLNIKSFIKILSYLFMTFCSTLLFSNKKSVT